MRNLVRCVLACAALVCACEGPPTDAVAPAEGRVWLLSDSQHANAIRDLLGVEPLPVVTPGVSDDLFVHEASLYRVGGALLHQYRVAAEDAAAQAVARIDQLLPCDPATDREGACARAFIDELASRAYRRPLAAADVDELVMLFEVGRADGFEAGIQLVIEAVLQSPDFLYRTELGDPADDSPVFELTPYELASAISFLFLDSIPDDPLWNAARDGSLADPAVVAEHVDRLLASPRVRAHLDEVVLTWIGAHRAEWAPKSTAALPEFDEALAASMTAETAMFVDDVLWRRGGSLVELLTSSETFIDERLAALYGVEGVTGSEMVAADLGPERRGGVLSQASLLTGLAGPRETSIVRRGLFVQRNLLCAHFDAPPTAAIAAVEDETSELTERELADYRAGNAICAGCHALIDPPGIVFEHYDAIGRWRDVVGETPVRATAVIELPGDAPREVTGVPELAALLADHPAVAACVVEQFLRRAYGRSLTATDQASVDYAVDRFEASQRDLVELFRAITETDAFRWRAREAAP